ncbi:MAG TPA: peptidoglycan-binding domain-containing protein [Crinalium sp.]|jgi:murein L,D-transpeptidase YcbB/YkuD
MDCSIENLVEQLIHASQKYAATLAEYQNLALKSELTEDDADRMAAIYTEAEHSPLLNFLINELDYRLGQHLGLLSPDKIKQYEDQQAWLREHLQGMPIDHAYRRKVQQLLQKQNFYDGAIDGVLGKRSVEAVEQFQRAQRLKEDGVPGQLTFAALQSG